MTEKPGQRPCPQALSFHTGTRLFWLRSLQTHQLTGSLTPDRIARGSCLLRRSLYLLGVSRSVGAPSSYSLSTGLRPVPWDLVAQDHRAGGRHPCWRQP